MCRIKNFSGNLGLPLEEPILRSAHHQNRDLRSLAGDRRPFNHCSPHGCNSSEKVRLHCEPKAENCPTGTARCIESPAINRGVFIQVVDGPAHKAHVICPAQAVILESIPRRDASPVTRSVTESLWTDTDIAMIPHEGLKLAMVSLHRSPGPMKAKHHRILLLRIVVFRQADKHLTGLTVH